MKIIFIAAGFIFTALGLTGVFLPILPTVPFLLLASVCFAKGSERINLWFKSTSLYKNNLEEFQKSGSMTLKTKLLILIPVSIMLLFAFLMMQNIPGRVTIVVLLVLKYYFFMFRIKTAKTSRRNDN